MYKMALLAPHDWENPDRTFGYVNVVDAETEEKHKRRYEYLRTPHGRIRVIRNNAISKPSVIDIATEVTLMEDNKIRYI